MRLIVEIDFSLQLQQLERCLPVVMRRELMPQRRKELLELLLITIIHEHHCQPIAGVAFNSYDGLSVQAKDRLLDVADEWSHNTIYSSFASMARNLKMGRFQAVSDVNMLYMNIFEVVCE